MCDGCMCDGCVIDGATAPLQLRLDLLHRAQTPYARRVPRSKRPIPAPAAAAFVDSTEQRSLDPYAHIVPLNERPPAAPAAAPHEDSTTQTALERYTSPRVPSFESD